MIVPREAQDTVVDDELEEGDVRTMSPRRNSEEVDKLGEEARRDLIEQAKVLQTSLQAIVDKVETVKNEHEKLEGGNKFLQSYVHAYNVVILAMLTSSQVHRRAHANLQNHIIATVQERQRPKFEITVDTDHSRLEEAWRGCLDYST